jgi:hypothetical protein
MPGVGDDIEADVAGDEQLPDRPFGTISFANLDETDFEEFCHDLLIELGLASIRGAGSWSFGGLIEKVPSGQRESGLSSPRFTAAPEGTFSEAIALLVTGHAAVRR